MKNYFTLSAQLQAAIHRDELYGFGKSLKN